MAGSTPHLHRIHPSTTAITAIVFVTLVLSGFIYYSVAEDFNRYDEAVAVIRAQRTILDDLLTQETALRGYMDTRNPTLLQSYQRAVAKAATDLDRLDRAVD